MDKVLMAVACIIIAIGIVGLLDSLYKTTKKEPEEAKINDELIHEEEYLCFVCKKKFMSEMKFVNNHPLCGEKCAKKYIEQGFYLDTYKG